MGALISVKNAERRMRERGTTVRKGEKSSLFKTIANGHFKGQEKEKEEKRKYFRRFCLGKGKRGGKKKPPTEKGPDGAYVGLKDAGKKKKKRKYPVL